MRKPNRIWRGLAFLLAALAALAALRCAAAAQAPAPARAPADEQERAAAAARVQRPGGEAVTVEVTFFVADEESGLACRVGKDSAHKLADFERWLADPVGSGNLEVLGGGGRARTAVGGAPVEFTLEPPPSVAVAALLPPLQKLKVTVLPGGTGGTLRYEVEIADATGLATRGGGGIRRRDVIVLRLLETWAQGVERPARSRAGFMAVRIEQSVPAGDARP